MPSPLTSSFASAAASSNGETTGDRRGNPSDWTRSRPNGATQTFRRTSTNATTTRDSTQPPSGASNAGVYIPPHLNANYQRNGSSTDGRYGKDELLSIYQRLQETRLLDRGLEDLFQGTWNPLDSKNGTENTWNGRSETKDSTTGPEVCWDYEAGGQPFGMSEMSEEERQLFSLSVNSPLKLPQTNTKESATGGIGGRKTSISGHQAPGQRRREASESFASTGPLSPTGTKPFFRDESSANTPPPALLRRRTDLKDEGTQSGGDQRLDTTHADGNDSDNMFGGLKRSTTVPLNSGLTGSSSSPWSGGVQSSAFDSMGTFGSFAVGSSSTSQDTTDRRPGFGSGRGMSRFKDLLSKGSTEDMSPSMKEKASLGSLEKLPEEDSESVQTRMNDMFKTRPNRSETNPYQDMGSLARGGSAALGGARDPSSPGQGVEQMGFSSFGLPGNIGPRDFSQREDLPYQTPHSRDQGRDQMSPTSTNPYQSPHGDRQDLEDNDTNDSESQPSVLGPFGSVRRNVGPGNEDRPSSRGLQGLNSLGGLPGFGGSSAWGTSSAPGNRPAVSSAFGDPIFSPMSDLQSPSLGGLGGTGFFGSNKARPSKLGALFPPAMQEQMRDRHEGSMDSFDNFQNVSQRDPFDGGRRREDPSYRGSAYMEGSEDSSKPFNPQSAFPQPSGTSHAHIPITAGPPNTTSGRGLSQSSESSGSNQIPTAQQKQMVMPDRMRWVYRDPQGKMQGPWSGLEMHDWFKAGFFTAELQVKKLEDAEYEPLAQLVRRIGNSREPFLVPQIGVPHGPASATQGNHWASPTLPGAGTPQAGSAQPPFASSFPSFGTTLTAEQQNALERRKQEEQFLMARQKEHLAQQQVLMKQALQMQGGPHGMHSLQHHSSAHSLQSQPSFGSITSPSGYQPSPMQGPIQPPQNVPSFFEGGARQLAPTSNMGLGRIGEGRVARDEDLPGNMDRMSLNQRSSQPFGPFEAQSQDPQVASMLQDRARLQMEQQQSDMRNYQDAFLGQSGQNDRLHEFQSLRGQGEDESVVQRDASLSKPIGAPPQRSYEVQSKSLPQQAIPSSSDGALSLSQQVQKAAASNQVAAISVEVDSPWTKVEKTPQAAPPPLSISPLPAPAAQRNRQHVADALAAESRSQSQTPVETTSSIAPWAEKTVENARGPSLKQIQEAEARRAAEQAELATAARRAQLEQELLDQPPPQAPGLPSTSTWGTASPAIPTTTSASAWGKATAGKPSTAATNGSAKKTLAQIQKEEEARKQRAAAAASAQAASVLSATGGKRYAELAGKAATATAAAAAAPNSAWTTVGSGGGKAKAPNTVIAAPQAVTRVVSGTAPLAKARPASATARTSTLANPPKAADELTKWAKAQLGKGLNNNLNVDDFVQDLLQLPAEVEMISEVIYISSQTLDGRRFAEEFVRRRKLADKGIVDPANNGTPPNTGNENKSGGGWSEVAKKGPAPKEDNSAAFKVVATKKKGKR